VIASADMHFPNLAMQSFGFLRVLGFVAREEAGPFEQAVTFLGPHVAVRVASEPIEGQIFVYLIRAEGGKLPRYPDGWVYLDAVVAERAPKADVEYWSRFFGRHRFESKFTPRRDEDVIVQLHAYAEALQRYGGDILRGDSSVLEHIEAKSKQFWRDNVWRLKTERGT
jgi:hypothetical protein